MTAPSPDTALSRAVAPLLRAWPAALAAGLAMLVGLVSDLLNPMLVALVLGMIVANSPWSGTRVFRSAGPGAKTLLRVGIVLLGTQLTWEALAALGVPGLLVALVTVVVVYLVTCWVGDRLGLERGLVTLVAAGFAICGAAAIVAVESTVRRRERDIPLALAMVTLFGTVMIFVVPAAGAAMGLSAVQTGVWAGASIHEVAQVVAAASLVGSTALAAAMTVKLARVALLVFAVGASRWRGRKDAQADGQPLRVRTFLPWFLLGFVLAGVLSSAGLIPSAVQPGLDTAVTVLLAAGMFGLGLGVRFRALFPLPGKVVLLSTVSTAVAAAVPLGLVLVLF